MTSENPWSADNQQERLVDFGWVIGFVDGEGCFSIGVIRNDSRTGFQVFPEFVVTQGARSKQVLHQLQSFFGAGQVVMNRRTDNHREPIYRYVVRRRSDLMERVLPFFERYPLRTAKRLDFERFASVVRLMNEGQHRTREGLMKILGIGEQMNRQKPRAKAVKILRDLTPDTDDNW
jgi:LAGLIDADG endonuclease